MVSMVVTCCYPGKDWKIPGSADLRPARLQSENHISSYLSGLFEHFSINYLGIFPAVFIIQKKK
jgi:hypothetical protein